MFLSPRIHKYRSEFFFDDYLISKTSFYVGDQLCISEVVSKILEYISKSLYSRIRSELLPDDDVLHSTKY